MTKIWILWDGQLWQLTVDAAKSMWYQTIVYGDGWKESPAGQVSDIIASCWYDEKCKNIQKFIATKPDIVSSEWENIPTKLIKKIEEGWLPVKPQRNIFEVIQNRITEKTTINNAGATTAYFQEVNNITDLQKAYKELWDGILKTTTQGYDGKWQARIYSNTNKENIIESFKWAQLIYEKMIDFKIEISVIVWRRKSGEMIAFEPAENIHENWILKTTITPCRIDKNISEKAKEIAMNITESMWVEWLLSVEMFVLDNGKILINELAPRPHNSWHATIESYNQSKYNILIKAILDEPFEELKITSKTVMHNLLWNDILSIPGRDNKNYSRKITQVWNKVYYDYWKKDIKKWRKMWHIVIWKNK